MAIKQYTNAEILNLITTGKATYHMKVYSTDWHEELWFDGIVFIGLCSCNEIGTRPICAVDVPLCFPPKTVTAVFI